jgi:hypothetical protein
VMQLKKDRCERTLSASAFASPALQVWIFSLSTSVQSIRRLGMYHTRICGWGRIFECTSFVNH